MVLSRFIAEIYFSQAIRFRFIAVSDEETARSDSVVSKTIKHSAKEMSALVIRSPAGSDFETEAG